MEQTEQCREIVLDFLKRIGAANKESTKKEHFKDLLHRLYAGKEDVHAVLNNFSAGAEKSILNY